MANAATPRGDAVWKSASCLGCSSKVSVHRDSYVVFNGLPDGLLLFVAASSQTSTWLRAAPAHATLYLLGQAKRHWMI
jgi:hypothetical protein